MAPRVLRGPEFRYPLDEGTLGQFFFNNAEKYKDHVCQIDGTIHKTETYGSVKLRSTRVAIALQKKGITSTDVITFCSANTLDNTIPMLAAFYLGAKVTNLDASLSVRHTNHLLSLVTPKIIFVEESSVNLIEESLVGTDFHTEIVVFGRSTKYSSFSDYEQPQENEEQFRPQEVDVKDDALMLFSSGTTGLPKAIRLSHQAFSYVTLQVYQTGIRDAVFHFTAFYWMTAYMILTTCFKSGSYRIFSRNSSIEDIFKIIEKYKVSCLLMPPILSYKFTSFENADQYDTTSIKLLLFAGTPMAVSQIKKIQNVFPTGLFILACGMSEIGVVSCFDVEVDKELAKKKISSCGKPGPGIIMKIVNPDTEELLGPNQKGEIRLKAPSIMSGYYHRNSSQEFDKDGFFKTGDIGYYDDDECVYVIERIKEMFKYQSWHIIPTSIEAALLEHPAIKEVAVFGLPHAEDGEVPAACVVVKEGFTLSEEEIDAFLRERVADRERLRGGVTFVDLLPKTPTGKIVRKEVKNFVIKLKGL